MATQVPRDTRAGWTAALEALPEVAPGGRLPSIFLAHGSPMLLWPKQQVPFGMMSIGGPDGPHAKFLVDFGKFIMERYRPRALVVFSAHWETRGHIEVMSYEKNHLYYDYGGMPEELYQLTWDSVGSPAVAARVAELLNNNKVNARTISKGRGLDHGVFIPFKLMFPDPLPIPLVEVSIDHGLDPQYHINIGAALEPLRDEGILIISGGLTIHSFREPEAWDPKRAPKGFKDFEQAIVSSIDDHPSASERNEALKELTKHPFFRRAHPREEHFIPIYVAAGAGTQGLTPQEERRTHCRHRHQLFHPEGWNRRHKGQKGLIKVCAELYLQAFSR